jgi:flagellar biosynthesis/type III secretory pathway protein FliH
MGTNNVFEPLALFFFRKENKPYNERSCSKMNKEQIEEELKETVKKGKSIANKVALGAIGVGIVYLLGASKGMKVGHAQGYLKGYAKATHDIADMIRQGGNVVKPD